jgi:hypothetical protein
MQRLGFLTGCLLVLASAGCRLSSSSSPNSNGLESCFDVGNGTLQCIHTPKGLNKTSIDVNHDGHMDAFVCGTGKPGSGHHGDKDKDPAEHDDDRGGAGGGDDHEGAGGAGGRADKDDGEGDDDDDGVGNHDDCDRKGCAAIPTGGPGDKDKDGKPDVEEPEHSASGAGGSSGDKDTGDKDKGDDEREGSRGHVMMCADGGAAPPPTTPPPTNPPPSNPPPSNPPPSNPIP